MKTQPNFARRLWTDARAYICQKRFLRLVFLVKSALILLLVLWTSSSSKSSKSSKPSSSLIPTQSYFWHLRTQINVATVACGKAKYLPNLVKSVLLFGQDENIRLNFIIFSDEEDFPRLELTMNDWKSQARNRLRLHFTYELHPTWFPSDGANWRTMYANCSTQRLFFGSLLKHIDALIYLDQDTLVVGNVSEIWRVFSRMSDQQMIALGPDNPDVYNSEKKTPYVGSIGVNAGVTLMNLTRLREFEFERRVTEVYKKWTSDLTYADQDVINIIFYDNPDKIYVLPCSFNFFRTRCFPRVVCSDVEKYGVFVLHGAYFSFTPQKEHRHKKFFFPWIYLVFQEYNLGDNETLLLHRMTDEYSSMKHDCASTSAASLTQNAAEYFKNLRNVTAKDEHGHGA